MQVLHRGFVHSGEIGKPSVIIAVQGNLSEAALRVVPKQAIVLKAGNNTGLRSALACPRLESFLGVETAEEFCALAPAGNGILKSMPNHLFIGPDVFLIANGTKITSSSHLALRIIEQFCDDPEDDHQGNESRLDEAGAAESIIAFFVGVHEESLGAGGSGGAS